jgi:nucleoside-diphosphate-sugar epimerase
MKLLITGASGFIGRYVVAEAIRRGHDVRAMIRPASATEPLEWIDHPAVEIVRADLRSRRGLVEAVTGIDTVVHVAAAVSGDFYGQFAGTVMATENLLLAMEEAQVNRIALVSSFAVYDYIGKWSHTTLDESSAVEPKPEIRHPYCQTKLMQENLVREFCNERGWPWTVLRPGAVYGRDHLWTTRLGIIGSRWWIRIGAHAAVPLTYVENCAEAIVLAAESENANGRVFNIVDDNPPSQRRYMKELKARTQPRPNVLPVSWTIMRMLARSAWLMNRVFFGGRAKIPAILVPESLHASAKPLRYSNEHLKTTLGWRCRYTRQEALDRSTLAA